MKAAMWGCQAVVAAAVALPTVAAAQSPCLPAAHLRGDAARVERVAAFLAENDVKVAAASACSVLVVDLIHVGEAITVAIEDEHGRRVTRTAGDERDAAAIVESFVRRDLSDPLLAARVAPPRPPEPTAVPAPATAERATAAVVASARRILLSAGAAAGLGSDGSLWTGMRVQACVQLGPVCIGGQLSRLADTRRTGLSADLDSRRTELGFHGVAEVPRRWGRLELSPSAGVGYALLEAEVRQFAETYTFIEPGARLFGRLSASYAVNASFAIRLDLAADVAPTGPERFIDPDTMNPDPDVAGIARARGWLGASLVYGGL
jgi:hypothetical protein